VARRKTPAPQIQRETFRKKNRIARVAGSSRLRSARGREQSARIES
jgi:hypothetical protein